MSFNNIKKNKYIFSIALLLKSINPKKYKTNLNKEGDRALKSLKNDGVAIIENFFSDEQCKELIDIFERKEKKHSKKILNDKRIFGINHLSDLHNKIFTNEPFFKDVAKAYLGEEVILQTTMAAKITARKSVKHGSGGGWHRDSFSRQFKAVIYLNDVSIDGGPFQYIKGSHKLKNIIKVLLKLNRNYAANYPRYSSEDIEKIKLICNQKTSELVAPKGTLILVDTRGIHTGKIISSGSRYSLFNYFIAKSWHQSESNIEKLDKKNQLNF